MRNIPIILNAVIATLSIGFFLYTFVAVDHLEGLAREFVTEKTLGYSRPVVDAVEKSLESPLVIKLLPGDHAQSIRREIDSYREDPSSFVRELTGSVRSGSQPKRLPSVGSKIESFKNEIRSYYDSTLTALILDFRIFSGSNAVAGMLALALALRSPLSVRKCALWFSFLLFAAVLFSSYLYIDGMSFFRILFRSHMGWWYPVSLAFMVAKLFKDYGRLPFDSDPATEERER